MGSRSFSFHVSLLRTTAPLALLILVAGNVLPGIVQSTALPAVFMPASVAGATEGLELVYHSVLHSIGLGLGLFLLLISTKAYVRDRRTRLLYLATAFSLMALREAAILWSVVLFHGEPTVPSTKIELGHIFDIIIFTVFSAGTLKK